MKQKILDIVRGMRRQRFVAGYSTNDCDAVIALIDAMAEPLTLMEQQQQFSGIAGYELPKMPVLNPDETVVRVRHCLIEEEAAEVLAALAIYKARKDVVSLAQLLKELADLIYVATGTAAAFGADIAPVLEAVHRSNMSKAGAPVVNGKLQKGDAYKPPDIVAILGADFAPF